MDHKLYQEGFTKNRELSWLQFNDHVLSEAMDEDTPLLERLKFTSIFTSNLDEFFMIRVGSLFDLTTMKEQAVDHKSGLTPRQQLDSIYQAVRPMYQKRDQVFFSLEEKLRANGIFHLSYSELSEHEQKYVKKFFKSSVFPTLSPQIVDSHHPFPHLQNKVIYIAAMLKRNGKEFFSLIPLPPALPELVFLPSDDLRYIRIESILLEFVEQVFDTYTVVEKVQICITRNADINPDDETLDLDSDFRKKMKRVLGKRRRLTPVRLELSQKISGHFVDYLGKQLTLTEKQIYLTHAPINLSYVFQIPEKLPDLKRKPLIYPEFVPQIPASIRMQESIFRQIQKSDILLSFPYESMEPFLQMIKEAAHDPNVISIKIAIYRLARKTKLVEYLCAAAENGKDVTVLIELRARFDEQNNIDWSERLEEAGCRIIYGLEDYKVHAKICLITRKERNEIKYITQVGTGNYNEKTATMYTDLSLLTYNQSIGCDASEFFKNMGIGNLEGRYQHLLVAPVSLKKRIIRLIEIESEKGEEGFIFLKLNSLTDGDIMEKLKQASCAGVTIKLFVRGICCLIPGIEGKTEHIQVCSIVGRFLEHSRVYCFGKGEEQKMFISSSDFMTRNTERRVEVACPIEQDSIKASINEILETIEYDNCKARMLLSNGEYIKKQSKQTPIDSQQILMQKAIERSVVEEKKMGILERTRKKLKRFMK